MNITTDRQVGVAGHHSISAFGTRSQTCHAVGKANINTESTLELL